jgi:hypothetical protein
VHDIAVPCFAGTNGGAGIVVGGGARARTSRDVLVEDNRVEDIGTGARDGRCRAVNGIYASVPRVTIVNNIVQRVVADGITSWHAARDLTIANNLSIANGGHGILIGSGDSDATSAGHTGTVVANNVVYRNTLSGIGESSDGSHPVGPGNRFLNNLAFANEGSASGIGGLSRGEIVAGTVDADPQLDPQLRPRANSPAIDAGTCVVRPRRDLAGVIRPQGRGVDIGPYERRSSPGRCAH